MSKRKNEQESGSKVKLYKTKHGWFSALTRFFKLFSFRSKKEVKPTNFNDLDSLKDKHDSAIPDAYKKGAATMATLLGAGVIGTTSPTEAHAATTTVDQNSHVVGSGSTSTSTSTSQMTGSTSTSTSTTSGSTSTSTVSSTSSSTSTTTSTTGSTSTSQSTGSTSASTSTSIASGSGSTSISNSTSTVTDNSSIVISGSSSMGISNLNDSVTTSVTGGLTTKIDTENITNATVATLFGTNLLQTNTNNVVTKSNSTTPETENVQVDREVSTANELISALQDSSVSTIKLISNITLDSTATIKGNRNITIYGNGKYINSTTTDNGAIYLNEGSSNKVNLTIENATLYNRSEYGFVDMWTGQNNVTYKDVTAYGGTLVWTSTTDKYNGLTLAGTTTLNSVPSYTINGQTYKTYAWDMGTHSPNTHSTNAIYVSNAVNIADNANVTVNNTFTNIDFRVIGDNSTPQTSVVTVGKNATLTMDNGNNTAFNIKLDGTKSNAFTVDEGAKVQMSAKVDNVRIFDLDNSYGTGVVSFAKGSNVIMNVQTGSNLRMGAKASNQVDFNGTATLIKQSGVSTDSMKADNTQGNIEFTENRTSHTGVVNFNPGSNVTLQAGAGASNITTHEDNGGKITATVNINNPEKVTLNTDAIKTNGGVTYLGNASKGIVVNVNNASVKVNDNNFSDVISSNTTTVTGSTVNVGSVSMASTNGSFTNASTSLSGSVSYATSMATSQLNAVNTNSTSTVVYQGSTVISQSISTSVEQSQSASAEQSQSASSSESIVQSQSRSTSTSESLSGSISEAMSESA